MNPVGEDESFLADLEDESIEVECLLVEPKNEFISVNGILCLGEEKPEMCPHTDGGPDFSTTREGADKLKVEVCDLMPHEVDEGEHFQEGNIAPCACDDYLLDFEFAESFPTTDHASSEGLYLGISNPASQVTKLRESDNKSLGIIQKLSTISPITEYQNDLLDKSNCKLHCGFVSKCECETSDESKTFDKLENISHLLEGEIFSTKNEDLKIAPLNVLEIFPKEQGAIAFSSQKRSRKPTQRYIEESSDPGSRHSKRKQRISTPVSSTKLLGDKCYKHQGTELRAMTVVTPESIGSFSIPVPFGSPVRREEHKKHQPIMVFNPDEGGESEDEYVTTLEFVRNDGGRRKHHRPWNLTEVKKLIDGVSQYGVGRWSVIKKLLFSSSAHRTPVDLKDKWRNLLRASCVQMKNKGEGEEKHKQKHACCPLPKFVLHRVRELAIVYPYPRERKSKLSCVRNLSGSPTPSSLSGRIMTELATSDNKSKRDFT